MSHFYGSMKKMDSKGQAYRSVTTTGTKKTGLTAHIRGWNVGVKVLIRYNEETGKDEIEVYSTGGSNDEHMKDIVATIKE